MIFGRVGLLVFALVSIEFQVVLQDAPTEFIKFLRTTYYHVSLDGIHFGRIKVGVNVW